ncbi:hypothetical protein FRC07_005080 [Ceratobasidium sp. 392]|nr:hypothetical protein FRC07_005080 [Ceratobasidium sp. 392]
MDVAGVVANVTGLSLFVGLVPPRVMSLEGDARRPATKQLVESLRVKIQVLETELARLRGQEPADEAESLLGGSLFVEGLDGSQEPLSTSTGSSAEGGLMSEESPIPVGLAASPSSSLEIIPTPPLADFISAPSTPFTATVVYKYIFQIDTSLAVGEQSTDSQLSLVCDWNRHLPDLDNAQLSRLEHDVILSRCFKYGTSWLLGLVPEIFLHDMLYSLTSPPSESQSNLQTRLQHYTPMLHCAIFAFASGFSDDASIGSRATRDKFAAQAKRWLDHEFEQPVMSLVRSLALLAEYHIAIGERETGYMYMGMSIRAARAMLSTSQQVPWADPGIVGYPESVTREWHFWSTFTQDKLMSLDFGRFPDMPVPITSVNLPSIDSEMDSQPWPMSPADAPTVNVIQPKSTSLVFSESCKLLVIANRIIEVTSPQGQVTQGDAVALNLHLQLDTWFNNLPEGLLVWARSTPPLPHVIMLHICYWWLLIHLHRPFYHRTQPPNISAFAPATNHSVKMCDRGAHKIVQLLKMFDIQHGFRFFPRNMLQASRVSSSPYAINSCGDALLMESVSSPPGAAKKRATAHEGVGVCILALRTVSPTWPCAEAFANELEARLEEQRPSSNEDADIEVDELAEDDTPVYQVQKTVPDAAASSE